jgi:hypothetical protein
MDVKKKNLLGKLTGKLRDFAERNAITKILVDIGNYGSAGLSLALYMASWDF